MYYPNLVKDHPELFLNIEFHLDWIDDSKMRDLMKRHFAFEEMAYPDVDTQAYAVQARADLLAEHYNKLFSLIGLSEQTTENPLWNYDRFEDIEEATKNKAQSSVNSDTLGSQFPMDKGIKKPVSESEGKSNANTSADGALDHHGHVYGNIGVQTLGAIEESTEEMYARLYRLKERYLAEFDDYFMLSM